MQKKTGLLSTKIWFNGKEISLIFEFLERREAEFLFEEIFVRDEYVQVIRFTHLCTRDPWFDQSNQGNVSTGHVRSTG